MSILTQLPASITGSVKNSLWSVAAAVTGIFSQKPVCVSDVVTAYTRKRNRFENEKCVVEFINHNHCKGKLAARKVIKTQDASDDIAREKICLELTRDCQNVVHALSSDSAESVLTEDAGCVHVNS